jgi:rRNA maturation endonuclease Nob1
MKRVKQFYKGWNYVCKCTKCTHPVMNESDRYCGMCGHKFTKNFVEEDLRGVHTPIKEEDY